MPLRLNARWRLPSETGPWLTGMPVFAESTAYERLLRELRRYVEDDVTGRSILIAGHRGAGKTTTVLQAVRVLRDEILLRSRNLDDPGLSRRRNLQRPLLVKLVGKGLLEPLPVQPETSQAQGPSGAAPGQPQASAPAQPPAPQPAPQPAPEQAAGNALAHITIALYRALAREVAAGFANHVRDRQHDAEHAELAAQLALELDSNPDAATLRSFWDGIGRLEDGVLFWAGTDYTLAQFKLRNQGMREIIALTTAAQAFEICLGQVSGNVTRSDEGSRDDTQTLSGDLKDLVTRLGTLAAGTAAGSVAGVTANSAATGVGIGLLVFLLAGLTMSFQSVRKRKRTSTVAYSFIRDRSIQTLDRDLPHVLDRIRQAGLAPIFVIDEIDKLDDPDKVISELIGRLKHLISDYGFFCFLTDRDYFDRVERRVVGGTYPVEHTYFSDRLLVVNRPADLRGYLHELIQHEPPSPEGDLARLTLAYALMYRSKLNFTQVEREFSAMLNAEGEFVVDPGTVIQRGGIRLAATIQVAIDHVIDTSAVRTRFIAEPAFAHHLLDALYWIPRRWEKDATQAVEISFPEMKAYLRSRAQPPNSSQQTSSVPAGEAMSEGDLQAVWQLVLTLMRHLAALDQLQVALSGLARAPVILAEAGPLLRWKGDSTARNPDKNPPKDPVYCYEFLLDRDANRIEGPGAETPLSPDEASRITAVVEKLEALKAAASASRVSLATLAQHGITLPLLGEAAVNDSLRDARALNAHGQKGSGGDSLIAQLKSLAESVDSHERRVVEVLAIASDIAARLGGEATAATVIPLISRYFGPAPHAAGVQSPALAPVEKLGELPAALAGSDWKRRAAEAGMADNLPSLRWKAWETNVADYFEGKNVSVPTFDDMLLAAGNTPPGSLFRRNLGEMDLVAWSKVTLAGLAALFPPAGVAPPPTSTWALPAGLRALNFAVADYSAMLPTSAPFHVLSAMAEILRPSTRGTRGLVYVYPDEQPPSLSVEPDARPILAVAESEAETYLAGLEWLTELGLIEGTVDERHHEEG